MSEKSKLTLTTLLAATLTLGGYGYFALGNHAPAIDNIRAWAIALLIYIAITVIVMILVQISFRIFFAVNLAANNQARGLQVQHDIKRIICTTLKEDEMDKLISLKAIRVNYTLVGLGSLLALVLLSFNVPGVYALHAIFVCSYLGGLLEGILSITYYEKGF